MANNWKLIFPVIHGVGNQDTRMQEQFVFDVVGRVKQRCSPALVDDHLLPFLPDWSGEYFGESNAWLTLLLYDMARSRMTDSDLSRWNITDANLEQQVWQIAKGKAREAIFDARLPLALAAVASAFTSDTLIEALGKAAPWSDISTLGREFQAHTLSDIVMYLVEEPRVKIISQLVNSSLRALSEAQVGGDTVLYTLFCGHSLGSVIAYDLLRAIVKWNTPPSAAGGAAATAAERSTTEFNAEKLGGGWDGARSLLDRLQPLGLITFGCPLPFFLFRKPSLIGQPDIWQQLCPAGYAGYFAGGSSPQPPWRWQNLWHPADFVAHRCEPYFNRGLKPERKFVEDIQLPGRYIHGVEAHSSYWGFAKAGYDMAAGEQVKEVIASRLAEVLTALPRQAG